MRRAFTFLPLALLVACENPVDTSPNILPRGDGTKDAAPATDKDGGVTFEPLDVPEVPDGDPIPCSDCLAEGKLFRVTKLEVTKLDGREHAVIGVLNPLWKEDIGLTELNIMFELTSYTDTGMELSVVSAARVGEKGGLCLLDETRAPLLAKRSGCFLTDSDPSAMDIYAGSQESPKNCTIWPTTLPVRHVIPVRNVKLSAKVSDDCANITEGKVLGTIAQDALAQICTCSTGPGIYSDACGVPDNNFQDPQDQCSGCGASWKSLMALLKAFGPLEYGCKTEDGEVGVCLEAVFEAVAVDPASACK